MMWGLAFWLMASGVYSGLLRLAYYWKPAHTILAKLVGADLAEGSFMSLKPDRVQIPFLFVSIGSRLALIVFGLWFLLHFGFYRQNLIFLLLLPNH